MRVKGFLLDVEGTLVLDKRYQPIEGAVEFIHRLRKATVPLRLITNNTTDSKASLVDKLGRAGFDVRSDDLHTCVGAAASYLRSKAATKCLVLGRNTLRELFGAEGFTVVDGSEVDAVVVGLDTDLTYERLSLACDAIGRRGASFVALHRNRVLLDSQGRCSPSVGAIVEAIRYATQVEPTVIGKPSPGYYQQALNDINLPRESVLVVSDDPLSDLAGAKRMGMRAAFVLCGKYRDRSVVESIPEPERPDIVVERIIDLLAGGLLEIRA
jgi:HAD superfamily hydrolase (TIGR01458 family)